MPAVTRNRDKSTGHSCFPPQQNVSASIDVYVNGKGSVRLGDMYEVHRCGNSSHAGQLVGGSSTVFVNDISIGRQGDPISCGGAVLEASINVFAN